jgi:hypothetical protein
LLADVNAFAIHAHDKESRARIVLRIGRVVCALATCRTLSLNISRAVLPPHGSGGTSPPKSGPDVFGSEGFPWKPLDIGILITARIFILLGAWLIIHAMRNRRRAADASW